MRAPPLPAPCSSTAPAAPSPRSAPLPPDLPAKPGWVDTPARHLLRSCKAHRAHHPRTWTPPRSIPSASPTSARPPSWDRATGVFHHERHRSAVPPHGPPWWRPSRATRLPRPRSPHARGRPTLIFRLCKLAWILGEVPGAWRPRRRRSSPRHRGQLEANLKLTDDAVHATDVTNASRTMPTTSTRGADSPLKAFGIPEAIFPRCALFRQLRHNGEPGACPGHPHLRRGGRPAGGALRPVLLPCGQAKNTYGTGCFRSCTPGMRPARVSTAS